MSPLTFLLSLFAISFAAGFLGSLVGLGGGIVIVPALTILYGIDIRYAIGASIVSVIATSSGAAAAYVRERMTNLRVAMLLEVGTTTGAVNQPSRSAPPAESGNRVPPAASAPPRPGTRPKRGPTLPDGCRSANEPTGPEGTRSARG
jgi:hypothetical protein